MTTITKKEKETLDLVQEKRYELLTSQSGIAVELGLKVTPNSEITKYIQRDICSDWLSGHWMSRHQIGAIHSLVDKICNSNGEIEFDKEAQEMLADNCHKDLLEIIRDKLDKAGIDSKYFTK